MKGKARLLGIAFRGLAMGAADVVPGVSGGTIAFITGIYEELLDSIKAFNLKNVKAIFPLSKESLKNAWNTFNLSFLLSLFAGIAISIVSLAGFISSILEQEGETASKINLWSFFFGLIIASIVYVAKQVESWNFQKILGTILGTALAYYITIAEIGSDNDSLIFLFFAGSIAISAMILPGISGSFILVLLGAYKPIMGAIKNLSIALKDSNTDLLLEAGSILAVVAVGCLVGLLSFSRVLSWLFKNQKQITLATLTGFMIGSLNKIWPWKKGISWRTNSDGEQVVVQYENLSPSSYTEHFTMDANLFGAIAFALLGFILVFLLEYAGNKMNTEKA